MAVDGPASRAMTPDMISRPTSLTLMCQLVGYVKLPQRSGDLAKGQPRFPDGQARDLPEPTDLREGYASAD